MISLSKCCHVASPSDFVYEQFREFDDGTNEEKEGTVYVNQKVKSMHGLGMILLLIQICDAQRPHYHDHAVHQTARFIPKEIIKRVIFVVGGAFMLLREYLEFDSLEPVFILELNQILVRAS